MQFTLPLSLLLSALLAPAFVSAQAQPGSQKNAESRLAPEDESRCRKDIKDYVDAMRFVRQSAGDQIGNRVAQNYVSEEMLQHTVRTQGFCAGAALLRSKQASR